MKFSKHNIRSAKLTPDQVLWIREQYARGRSQGWLSRETGMSVGQIGRIVRGESWQGYQQPTLEEDILDSEAKFKINLDAELMAKLAKGQAAEQPTPPTDPLEEFLKGKSTTVKGEEK